MTRGWYWFATISGGSVALIVLMVWGNGWGWVR